MQNKSAIPVILGYLYIVIPIIIFFIGWCNVYTAVLGTGIILVSLYFAIKNAPKIWVPEDKKQSFLLIVTALIVLIWVYYSGIGALVFQNTDHYARNGIFEALVQQSWPVISSEKNIILTYYIAFWLPSAVIAKVFNNIQIGYYFQIIWASLGIFLFFYYVLTNLKRKNLFPIILFIFFSGMDFAGIILTQQKEFLMMPFAHLEWWFPKYQFSSMTTQLFWVFNQALPAWIITMLILNEKNNKNIIFIYSCMFLHSTLPAIGILPFVIYFCLKNGKSNIRELFKFDILKQDILSCLTFQNIVGAAIVTLVSYFYLSNNISGQLVSTTQLSIFEVFFVLLIFFSLESGFYLFCIYKDYKSNVLFYMILLCLLIYPFITIGVSDDFCMRATIPALIILYLLIAKMFDNLQIKEFRLRHYLLIVFLIIGMITPMNEILRTVHYTNQGYTKVISQFEGGNFFGYVENNKFLKYFGKYKSKN